MEKDSLIPSPALRQRDRLRLKRFYFLTSFLLLASNAYVLYSNIELRTTLLPFTRRASPTSFKTNEIYWSPCPDSLETYCSFHRVPLNHLSPSANETVSLALRMLPSPLPTSQQLGYLFINPGGPGGSGTESVLRFGSELQTILDGRYNVISWDPRGVNLTSPSLGCFENQGDANRFQRDIVSLGLPSDSIGSESEWTERFDVYSQALQDACDMNADRGIMRSSTTAFAARDMLSIAESLGESKINYWGFSYGTILGATFAAMFPDKVNRFILDGVSDSVSYTQNFWQWGFDGMTDTHKTFDGFFSACAESGPKGCQFAKENSTSSDLKGRLEKIYEKLRKRPLAVGKSEWGPGVVTSSDVSNTIFHSLYAPKTWPETASLLTEVEAGNGSRLFSTANKWTSDLGRRSPLKHNPFHTPMIGGMSSAVVVMCADTDPKVIKNDTSVERLGEYMRDLKEGTGSPTSDQWSVWISQCRRWGVEPFETYRGPWTVKDGLNKTAFPILFLSLTADPVTPLPAARRMAANFGSESATLLIQEGFGHCSVSHPSLCTAKKARAYFLEGKVPKMNTTCTADEGFLFPHPDQDEVEVLSIEDASLRKALHGLAGKINERGTGLGPL
ncbi:hypothetical protein JCM5353_004456 [Sporobolomyces roseus]